MSLGQAVKVISFILYVILPITFEVLNVMSLGMCTLLSELLVIIKGKALLWNVALFFTFLCTITDVGNFFCYIDKYP